jgi:integration host factor subunit alpha|tara:strand:+ start:100 stop:387 length:288 start_codon:yes stop_codon:yes gene_type:complete
MNSKTWTRNDLVEKISSNVGLPNSTSSLIIENIFDFILSELENNEDVKISSFGSFIIRNKKSRLGRNPKTGIEAPITARNVVTFNPSYILKSKLN